MKQMPYEPGSGRSTAPGAPEIKIHTERLASDLSLMRQRFSYNVHCKDALCCAFVVRYCMCSATRSITWHFCGL